MVGVEALRPEGRGLMSRSRVGARGVASGEGRGCLCARRLYVRVGVPGQVRALGGGSGVMRGGSVRVRRPGLLTVGVCGEEASVGRRVAVRHFLNGQAAAHRRCVRMLHPLPKNVYSSRLASRHWPSPLTQTHQDAARITQGLLLTSSRMAKSQKKPGGLRPKIAIAMAHPCRARKGLPKGLGGSVIPEPLTPYPYIATAFFTVIFVNTPLNPYRYLATGFKTRKCNLNAILRRFRSKRARTNKPNEQCLS